MALLGRVSLRLADAASGPLEVHLDGWPLVLVDVDGGGVRVNDLRTSKLFAHRAVLRRASTCGKLAVHTGAVGDELYVLLGEVAAVFVVPDPTQATHADVRVIESSTGRLLLDRSVRYRQLPVAHGASLGCRQDRG